MLAGGTWSIRLDPERQWFSGDERWCGSAGRRASKVNVASLYWYDGGWVNSEVLKANHLKICTFKKLNFVISNI